MSNITCVPTDTVKTIAQKMLELCWQIEACGASVQLTQASITASEIRQAVAALIPEQTDTPTAETKSARLSIKTLVDSINGSARKSRSRSMAITKLEEASMWLGKDLQELNEPNPYPNSFNPGSPVIDPTVPEACGHPGGR